MGLFLVFFIIFTITIYSQSISRGFEEYSNENMYENSIRIFDNFPDTNQLEVIKSNTQVRSVFSIFNYAFDKDNTINIGGKTYKNDKENEQMSVAFVNDESEHNIRQNVIISFVEDYEQNIFIFGRDIINDEDVLINERLLELYGIKERETLIGEVISFKVNDKIYNGKICGIVNKNILRGEKNNSYNNYVQITMQRKGSAYGIDYYLQDDYQVEYYIDLKDFLNNDSVLKTVEDIVGESNYNYFGNYYIEYMKVLQSQKQLCERFFSIISIGITLIVVLYLIINEFYFLQQNRKFYGILRANGISSKRLLGLCTLEILLVSVFSELLAIGVGISIFYIIKGIFVALLGIELPLVIESIALFIGVIVAFNLLYLGVIALTVRQNILKLTPIQLLKNK